jgi:type VI secretion system protein ImpE
MNAQTLLREGRLSDAIQAAGAQLRDDPANAKLRTFLFELLCFAGEFERAEKHLSLLSEGNKEREVGAMLYHAAIHAEQMRNEMFDKSEWPGSPDEPQPIQGVLNGTPFSSIEDADPRIGPRLEVFAAGNYLWIPFEAVESVKIDPPKRLRDLLWTPALLKTGPNYQNFELGEVLLPALTPRSSRHADEEVRLGRQTVWTVEDEIEVPYGQKSLLVDGEEIPFLEIRSLTIGPPQEGTDASS